MTTVSDSNGMLASESSYFSITHEISIGDASLHHVAETKMESKYLQLSHEEGNFIRALLSCGADSLESVKNSS